MPIFHYTARNMRGQLVNETLAFSDESALRDFLRKSNLFVLQIDEQRQPNLLGRIRRRIGLSDLIITTRQLRTMVQAGMPLVTGLNALADQTTNLALATVLTGVARSVGQGESLAATLEHYPRIFPRTLIALVRAGEEGGRLPETLREAGRQLELQMEMRQKLITAMVYPLFTLIATVGTVLFMLLYIVPIFADIYEELNARLPWITLSLVRISEFLVANLWIYALLMAAAVLGIRNYYRTPQGRRRIDLWKLKVPLVGPVFLKAASATFTGTLAGLLESGVPIVQALETSADTCGNQVLADQVVRASRNVVEGRRLSDELEMSGHFPLLVTRMIAIAEEVGTLPQVMREIAQAYTEEVEYAIRRAMMLIEPILILCVGAVVGYVLLALYYPIFNLGNVFLDGS